MTRIPRDSFRFCRYATAALMWLGMLSSSPGPIVIVWALMVYNAIVTVERAPLVVLYTKYIHPHRISPYQPVDVGSLRFSHSLAALLIGICLLMAKSGNLGLAILAHYSLWALTLLKTYSAVYECPAGKLYRCFVSPEGDCCSLLRRGRLRRG